jgi:transcriptional regulator with XRE-family HTH domain
MGRVPTNAEPPAREVARRREAVGMLRLAESIAAYAAAQLANGLSPEQARRAALDAAVELDAVAGNLRRLALPRLDVAERRALAADLAAAGMSPRQIAEQIGVAPSTVWDYLSGRRGMAGRSRAPFTA